MNWVDIGAFPGVSFLGDVDEIEFDVLHYGHFILCQEGDAYDFMVTASMFGLLWSRGYAVYMKWLDIHDSMGRSRW